MGKVDTEKKIDEEEVICHWSARKMQPIILVYVSAVYLAFILLSFLMFHSGTAVKALAITALSTIPILSLEVIKRIEYRLTRQVLEHRPIVRNKRSSYVKLFELDQLSYIKAIRNGFKFYVTLNETNPARKFWKKHFLSGFSGEAHVEKVDLKRVLDAFAQCRVTLR